LGRRLSGIDTVIHLRARAAFEPYPRLFPSFVEGSLNRMQAAFEAQASSFVFGSNLLANGGAANFVLFGNPCSGFYFCHHRPGKSLSQRQTIGFQPKYPSMYEGIPAVLDDSISFYWSPSKICGGLPVIQAG